MDEGLVGRCSGSFLLNFEISLDAGGNNASCMGVLYLPLIFHNIRFFTFSFVNMLFPPRALLLVEEGLASLSIPIFFNLVQRMAERFHVPSGPYRLFVS